MSCEVKEVLDGWPFQLSCPKLAKFEIVLSGGNIDFLHPLLAGFPYGRQPEESIKVCEMHMQMAVAEFINDIEVSEIVKPVHHSVGLSDDMTQNDVTS